MREKRSAGALDPGAGPGDPGALSDEQVVRRVRAGETELFEVVMRRYNQRLYRAVRSILRDEAESEDVLQQTYVSAYTHLDRFEGRSSLSTWLVRIARNAALDRVRRRGRLVAVPEPTREDAAAPVAGLAGGPSADPESQASARELARLLTAALDALPETSRSVFVLREIEGLSTAETADCLEIQEGAVKTRLHRARSLLRDRLLDLAGESAAQVFGFGNERCDRLVAAVLARLA